VFTGYGGMTPNHERRAREAGLIRFLSSTDYRKTAVRLYR